MEPNSAVPRDITHTTLAVLFIGMLIAFSFWVLRPFLFAFIWAELIVVATWPLLLKLQALLFGRRGLAVTAMTICLLLVVFVPLTLAVTTIFDNADVIVTRVHSLSVKIPAPPEWLGNIPLIGGKFAARWREFAALSPEERSALIIPYAERFVHWFLARAGSIGVMLVNVLLTVIISAILYAKGEMVATGVVMFARRMAGPSGEEVVLLAAKATRAVALGVVFTAIIQAALGAVGLTITGVPGASLLTAVMFMLCLAQVGPALVLVPSVIWLYTSDGAAWGTVLLVITIISQVIDNIIRPVFIKKGADLPLIMVFAGVIGGLIAFGVVGLFIGPVVLAVTYTLLKAWMKGGVGRESVG